MITMLLSFALSLWYVHLMEGQAALIRRSQAIVYACTMLEKLRAFGSLPQGSHPFYKVVWYKKSDFLLKGYNYITIEVRWQEQAKEQKVSLTTGSSVL